MSKSNQRSAMFGGTIKSVRANGQDLFIWLEQARQNTNPQFICINIQNDNANRYQAGEFLAVKGNFVSFDYAGKNNRKLTSTMILASEIVAHMPNHGGYLVLNSCNVAGNVGKVSPANNGWVSFSLAVSNNVKTDAGWQKDTIWLRCSIKQEWIKKPLYVGCNLAFEGVIRCSSFTDQYENKINSVELSIGKIISQSEQSSSGNSYATSNPQSYSNTGKQHHQQGNNADNNRGNHMTEYGYRAP